MKMKRLFLTAVGLFLFLTAGGFAQITNTVNFNGHVYAKSEDDSSASAIANASVHVLSFKSFGDSISYQATTDENGYFEFTGLKAGTYMVIVNAAGYDKKIFPSFVLADSVVSQDVYLEEKHNPQTSMITGKVTFEQSGEGVRHAMIQLINKDHMHGSFFAVTNTQGDYTAHVPQGEYYVSCFVYTADSMYFYEEFYKDAHSIADAQVIEVNKGEVVTGIDFQIPDMISRSHSVTINGTVKSDNDSAVANANVKVWATRHHRALVATAKTDAEGNYSITIDSLAQSVNVFVAGAFKDGYKVQFYDGKSNFADADLIFAFSDTTISNINFNLKKDEPRTPLSISGTVTDDTGKGINFAFVFASNSSNGQVAFALTDSTGTFSLAGLSSGNYYLLTVANGYIPEFYDNSPTWEDAAKIKLSNTSVTDLSIVLSPIPNPNGNGVITGEVKSDAGVSLAGVLVTAKSSGNTTVGYDITDESGSYYISGLSSGNYTLTASKPNYTSQQSESSYDLNSGNTQVNNFSMSQSITDVNETVSTNSPSKYELDNNYPNPFNPSTVIKFSLPENAHVSLNIYNILGQKVAQLVNDNLSAGRYSIKFDAGRLSSGIYFYKLQTDDFASVKKMILQK